MMMLASNNGKPTLVRVPEQMPLLPYNPKSLTKGKEVIWRAAVSEAGKVPSGQFVLLNSKRP